MGGGVKMLNALKKVGRKEQNNGKTAEKQAFWVGKRCCLMKVGVESYGFLPQKQSPERA